MGLFSVFYLKKNPFIVRQIKTPERQIFLTFDDGPDPLQTDEVLNLLNAQNWKATFFVVGRRAQEYPEVVKRMLASGHAVMSHSIDHAYWPYFKGEKTLHKWVQDSLQNLSELTGLPQMAFRPPAGVLTPPLVKVAENLKVPLIMWNQRYFDTTSALTKPKVQIHLKRLSPGDIVLLHDRQSKKRHKTFLETLSHYIREMKAQGYSGGVVTNDLLRRQIGL